MKLTLDLVEHLTDAETVDEEGSEAAESQGTTEGAYHGPYQSSRSARAPYSSVSIHQADDVTQ